MKHYAILLEPLGYKKVAHLPRLCGEVSQQLSTKVTHLSSLCRKVYHSLCTKEATLSRLWEKEI